MTRLFHVAFTAGLASGFCLSKVFSANALQLNSYEVFAYLGGTIAFCLVYLVAFKKTRSKT